MRAASQAITAIEWGVSTCKDLRFFGDCAPKKWPPSGRLRLGHGVLYRVRLMPTAADALTTYYTALLDGSYDCVDRTVLNANFGLCYSPGGFRSWWRVLHSGSDAELDNTHLMRMAGRFSRRVRGWAQAHGVPVIDCKNQERKHDIAEEFLKKNACVRGVFLILVSRAPATV